MKSRVTTYVLIAAVVGVWGFIAWKIFFARTDNTPAYVQRAPDTASKSEEEQPLSLDYKDPFLKDIAVAKVTTPATSRTPKKSSAVPSRKPNPPKKETPPMNYTGTIGTGDRVLYVFENAGLQQMLVPGDELAGFRLAEAWPDSVRFTKNGESYALYIHN